MELPETIPHGEIIARCKRGDPTGYTQLYNLYSKEVYNTIFRLVSHTAEAEDILQESFVAAFQAIHKFEHTGGFRAWIKRIATNKAIDFLRKKKIRFVELEPSGIVPHEEEPLDEDAFEYKVAEVNRAIDFLPEGYRIVVQLHVFEQITHVEIGRMLGLDSNTVKVQYHRARQRILRTLKNEVS